MITKLEKITWNELKHSKSWHSVDDQDDEQDAKAIFEILKERPYRLKTYKVQYYEANGRSWSPQSHAMFLKFLTWFPHHRQRILTDELKVANCFSIEQLPFPNYFIFHLRLLARRIDGVIVCHFALPESTRRVMDVRGGAG
jgi:hypothetical protein